MEIYYCAECADVTTNFCNNCKAHICKDCYDSHHTSGYCREKDYPEKEKIITKAKRDKGEN